jgi:hypothetical protein
MGFYEFEFRPIESFRYIEGFLVSRMQKMQARTLCSHRWSWIYENSSAPFKYTYFGNISIISGINEPYNINLLQVPWLRISIFIVSVWLWEIFKQKLIILQIVCFPQSAVNREPFRELPRILPWHETFRLAEQKGRYKLNPQGKGTVATS